MSTVRHHLWIGGMLVLGVVLGLVSACIDLGNAGNIVAEAAGGLVTFAAAWLLLDRQYRRRALAIKRRAFRGIGTSISHFSLSVGLSFEQGGVEVGPLVRARDRDPDASESLRALALLVRRECPEGARAMFINANVSLVEDAEEIVSLVQRALDGLEQFSGTDALLAASETFDASVSSLRMAIFRQQFTNAPDLFEPIAAVLDQCAAVYDAMLPLWSSSASSSLPCTTGRSQR